MTNILKLIFAVSFFSSLAIGQTVFQRSNNLSCCSSSHLAYLPASGTLSSDPGTEEYISPGSGFDIAIKVGPSFPLGEFAGTTDAGSGYALTGWSVGVDGILSLAQHLDWISSLDLSVNKTDESGLTPGTGALISSTSWSNVWLLTGLKVSGPLGESSPFRIFGTAQGGFLFGTSPEENLEWATGYSNRGSATATAFGYSVGAGVSVSSFTVSFRYLGGEPDYQVTTVDASGQKSGSLKQQTACLQLTAGLIF